MKKYFLIPFTLICLVIFMIGCRSKFKTTEERKKPIILVSIPPYVSIVKALAGDTVDVYSVIPPNFDPHTSEISPKQAQMIQTCNLWIGIGEQHEKKLLIALQEAKNEVGVLQLNESVHLLSYSDDALFVDPCANGHLHNHSSHDFHFWMSPLQLIPQVYQIKKALMMLLPENYALYQQNLSNYLNKLKEINTKITNQLIPYHNKSVVVSHPFLGYFCHDYNLHQIAIECEGKSPSIQSIDQALLLAKNYQAQCVFTSPQFNNKAALLFAKKLNLQTFEINPLDLEPLETIQKVVNAITKSE